jgi:phenylalanyl-tRNA synthetase beta chain
MKISYSWLQRYISPIPSAEETSRLLTASGLEVEGLELFESHKGGLKGLVVGEVKTCVQHPNADRLRLTTVDVGETELLSIVCGAPNVAAGQKVVVATIGTELFPSEGEAFTIKESKIRGELSQGMLCAEDEIGLGGSHAGIIVLPASTKIGTAVAELYNVVSDTVLEIGLTPNRSDAMSHFGVARDLAATLYTDESYQLHFPESTLELHEGKSPIQVTISANPESITRYAGICIQGVEVKQSPEWLQHALKSIGLKSINNIVDATNFVMHELGQPLHAFDRASIAGNAIHVKTCAEGTPFVTLDGVERKLGSNDLMICDAEKPLCIAGVFGGLHSGVKETTTSIFLESATFNAVWVRKTSRALGLKTDSSFRFERGADPEMPVIALERAASLIIELAGGSIEGGLTDSYPQPVEWSAVELTWATLDRLVGEIIPREHAISILEKLGIRIEAENTKGLKLSIPPFKVDVKTPADVTEEILRIYGYNTIAIPTQVRASTSIPEKPDLWSVKNHLSDHLCSIGFTEILNNSLTAGSTSRYVPDSLGAPVEILNPLSSELNIMRQSMLFGVCETIAWNSNRQQPDLAVYEWGKTYFKTEEGYREYQQLMLAVAGNATPENWHEKQKSSGYFQLKGSLESIFRLLGIDPLSVEITPIDHPSYEQAFVFNLKKYTLATLGSVHADVRKTYGINDTVWVADCNWDQLLKVYLRYKLTYQEVARFPSVRRDLSMLLDASTGFDRIVQIARGTERKLLRDVSLFDVYQGDNLPAGKKSYAVSFTFLDEEQTLTDKQIDKTMERLIKAYQDQIGAELRG